MPHDQLDVHATLDAQVDRVVNSPEVSGHVLGVVDAFFGGFGGVPTYPKLGITAVLGDKRPSRVVFFAFPEPERLPAHTDLQVISRPFIARLGGTQVARGKKGET